MSDSKSPPRRNATPVLALKAAMTEAATDPVRRAMWLDALGHQFRPCLPPALASHCRLANVAGDRLVFVVDSPVWRAKLRLAAPELLQLAQSIGLEVTEVTAKVSTRPLQAPQPSPRPVIPMSPASRKALQEALASLGTPDATGDDATTSPRRHRSKR